MKLHSLMSMATVLVLVGATARADEVIFVRGREKPFKGVIRTETPQGITSGKELFKADDIEDVQYDLTPVTVKIGPYKAAKDFEADALKTQDASGRKKLIDDAIRKYEETIAKMDTKGDAGRSALCHFQYKIATLTAREAKEGRIAPELAIDRLKKFAAVYPKSWQITRVLETLGQMQVARKDFDGAEQTYNKLAGLDLPVEAKQEAELMAVQVIIQAGKHDKALQTLQGLASKFPKESRFAARVKVAQAECQIGAKQIPEAQKTLQDVLRETGDKQIKAIAHNDLGKVLFDKGDFKEARWEFLWVDVLYNQDKAEHAKALYHLWKIYENLNDAEHAQECRETLLNGRDFAGLEYQTLAKREAK